jgi:hypothetical protein
MIPFCFKEGPPLNGIRVPYEKGGNRKRKEERGNVAIV